MRINIRILSVVIGLLCLLLKHLIAQQQIPPLITMLDVGQGDALLLQNSEGRNMLIDSGPSDNILFAIDKLSAPISNIDVALMSHPDSDHAEGLIALSQLMNIGEIWYPEVEKVNENKLWKELKSNLSSTTKILPKHQGQEYRWGCCIGLLLLWPPQGYTNSATNEISLSILVTYNGFDLLAMGDLSSAQELKLISYLTSARPDLKLEILKVSHHGSKTSTSKEVLDLLNPEVAIIGVGRDNSYGHPHASVLNNLQQRGIEVFRTDLQGNISVYVDSGGKYSVQASYNFVVENIELERLKVYNLPTYSLARIYV